MNLTKSAIERFKYEGKHKRRGGEKVWPPDIRWDDKIVGLGLRVYPPNAERNSVKSFVLSYRHKGVKRLMVIGKFNDKLPLDLARKKAKKFLANIDDVDPLEMKRANAKKKDNVQTVAQLCEAYLGRHAKVHKKSWRDDERRIDRVIVPKWGKRQADGITRTDVGALHTKLGKRAPYEANRIVSLLAKMYSLAGDWGIVPEGYNPARRIEPYREQKRDRWVKPDELPELAKAIDAEPNQYMRAAFWCYLLTGVRKSELLKAEWTHVDWQREELKLPDTKSGRDHYVPLTAPVLALLQDLPRLEDNPYVFPGERKGQHLVNLTKAWARIRKAAGIDDVRLHDLRRTVGSWLAQSGESLHLVGRVLGHSTPSTTQVYARFGEDHVREALNRHAAQVTAAAKGKKAEVTPIKEAEGA